MEGVSTLITVKIGVYKDVNGSFAFKLGVVVESEVVAAEHNAVDKLLKILVAYKAKTYPPVETDIPPSRPNKIYSSERLTKKKYEAK